VVDRNGRWLQTPEAERKGPAPLVLGVFRDLETATSGRREIKRRLLQAAAEKKVVGGGCEVENMTNQTSSGAR
jgi:hypothetical protein